MTTSSTSSSLRELHDLVAEGAPAEVRLDAEHEHGIARPAPGNGSVRRRRVVGPVDPPRDAVLERDVRTRRLEVVELLGVDVRRSARASHACARKLVASEAPCAPSFQPRKAATSTARRRVGRRSMRRWLPMDGVYGSTGRDLSKSLRGERDDARPHRGRERRRARERAARAGARATGCRPIAICASRSPRTPTANMRSPRASVRCQRSEATMPTKAMAKIPVAPHVEVERVREEPVALDLLAARVRAGGRDEGPRDDEGERARHEDDGEPVGRERRMLRGRRGRSRARRERRRRPPRARAGRGGNGP